MKRYEVNGEVLLAACDKDILNQKFEEGELQIEVSEKFYNGNEVNREGLLPQFESATIINLIGKEVVRVAQEEGLISENGVLWIDGIPHAQIITRSGPM